MGNCFNQCSQFRDGRVIGLVLNLSPSVAPLCHAYFHHHFAGIPVYGNMIIQNTAPETADADIAFVSAFKQCIVNLSKHVQTVREKAFHFLCCFFIVLSSITQKALCGIPMEIHFLEIKNKFEKNLSEL